MLKFAWKTLLKHFDLNLFSVDFNQLKSLCGAGSSSRYSAVIICHAVATAMAVVAVAVTAAADAAVKLLLKVTPKRRDMKELWLAAATFGSLAPLPLLSESEFCVSSTNCPQFSRWQKFCQSVWMLIFPASFGSVSLLSLNQICMYSLSQIKCLNLISLINSLNFIKQIS